MGFYYDWIVPRGPVPNISTVVPAKGNSIGGTAISINGTGFLAGAKVYCNGVLCNSIVIVSSILITAVTPASVQGGPVTIWIQNPNQITTGIAGSFVYSPIVDSVSPAAGSFLGTNTVSVLGSGFISGATVRFDGVLATSIVFVSANELQCVVPGGVVGPANIFVSNPAPDSQTSGTTGNGKYTYTSALLAPTVSSIAPIGGPLAGGNNCSVFGANFQAGATVGFLSALTHVASTFVSSGQLDCVAPAGTGTGQIEVVNPDGQFGDGGTYTYAAAPVVTSLTPSNGPLAGGTSITDLTGTGFQVGCQVFFDGILADNIVRISSVKLTCDTPAQPGWFAGGSVLVMVINPDNQNSGISGANKYTYNPLQDALLLETGDFLLLETGDKLLLE